MNTVRVALANIPIAATPDESIFLATSTIADGGVEAWPARRMGHVVVCHGPRMAELHSMRRGWRVGDGRVVWFEEKFISAVVPQGTAADNPATSSTEWIFAPVPPERDRALGSWWYFANWREWRAGSLGWYTPTGGAGSSRVVSVPLWPPALLLCVPSVLLLLRRRGMSRRLRAGACWSC